MYKITIDLSDWGIDDETMTIETHDFDKISIIKEFIEFQKDYGWAVDYAAVTEDDEEDEDEEDEEAEDGDFFYDEENGAWYQYDAENDEWIEFEEVEDEEEDEDEDEEVEAAGNTYIINITTSDDPQ